LELGERSPGGGPGFSYDDAVLKLLERQLRLHRLVCAGERVGIAVSGGADSVSLLRAMAELASELGIVPFVLHLNHRLRGADSDGDAEFVAGLARELGVEAAIESEDVAALAAAQHLSLEAAGRRARYGFFLRAAREHRLDAVATAHTRDDQAETVLLRLLRGAGTSGLAAIHRSFPLAELAPAEASTPGDPAVRLIRPLLAVSRRQVEEYLEAIGQGFRQDASNATDRFLRNRLRRELLPELEREYNPRLREALCETAEIAAAEDELLEELAGAALGAAFDPEAGVELELIRRQQVALQRRMLRRLCRHAGLALDFAHLEELRLFALAAHAGRLELPRGFAATIVREKLKPSILRLRPPA